MYIRSGWILVIGAQELSICQPHSDISVTKFELGCTLTNKGSYSQARSRRSKWPVIVARANFVFPSVHVSIAFSSASAVTWRGRVNLSANRVAVRWLRERLLDDRVRDWFAGSLFLAWFDGYVTRILEMCIKTVVRQDGSILPQSVGFCLT